mmetsp:Transcript_144207/g.401831  ORF Transcript_144207/g.401831 Transcript_144207/m.401831 type:complete len:260 (+) Transcript_144207:440-1219(+)
MLQLPSVTRPRPLRWTRLRRRPSLRRQRPLSLAPVPALSRPTGSSRCPRPRPRAVPLPWVRAVAPPGWPLAARWALPSALCRRSSPSDFRSRSARSSAVAPASSSERRSGAQWAPSGVVLRAMAFTPRGTTLASALSTQRRKPRRPRSSSRDPPRRRSTAPARRPPLPSPGWWAAARVHGLSIEGVRQGIACRGLGHSAAPLCYVWAARLHCWPPDHLPSFSRARATCAGLWTSLARHSWALLARAVAGTGMGRMLAGP